MTPSNQWTGLARTVNILKTVILALSIVIVALTAALGLEMTKPPVVVTIDGEQRSFYIGRPAVLEVGEAEIKKKIRQFVKLRFEWRKLDPAKIIKDLAPLTTPGLNKKLFATLMELRDQKLQGKETNQTVTNLNVLITKERVVATFDKVLRVEGIPLVVPTQISFNIVQGKQTVWNAEGIYIHGLIEHQDF